MTRHNYTVENIPTLY